MVVFIANLVIGFLFGCIITFKKKYKLYSRKLGFESQNSHPHGWGNLSQERNKTILQTLKLMVVVLVAIDVYLLATNKMDKLTFGMNLFGGIVALSIGLLVGEKICSFVVKNKCNKTGLTFPILQNKASR